MKLSKIRKGIVLAAVAGTLGLGCELIVDFDRTLIPTDVTDSATPNTDGSVDAPIDTFQPDAFTPDAADASDAHDAADSADANDD